MRVAILSNGIDTRNLRLQPHQTLVKMGNQLQQHGDEVVFISDHSQPEAELGEIDSILIRRTETVSVYRNIENVALRQILKKEAPQLLLWHLSLSSFLHQNLRQPFEQPAIGVLTSPVHRFSEILSLGPAKISSNFDLVMQHLLSALVPGAWIRRAFQDTNLLGMITLSQATRQYLIERGAPPSKIWVVPPAVDQIWLNTSLSADEKSKTRQQLQFSEKDFVLSYFGAPAPVRGINTILQAFSRLAKVVPNLKLLFLSRRWENQWQSETARLYQFIAQHNLTDRIRVFDGYLSQKDMVKYISASDLVCLPFEILPADVPLSILEAMALQKCILTTRIACIPELIGSDRGYLIPPGSTSAFIDQSRAIIENPSLASECGRCGREFIQAERTMDSVGRNLQAVLKMALS